MKKLILKLLPLLFILSCEDKKDTTPPEVNIVSPISGATVNEAITITCMSTDNKGVEKVELWVDAVNTGLTDNSEPYSFIWNTTTYTDGNHTLVVRAYDTNGNEGDSAPITIKVDNTISVPNPVNITEVSYTLTEMTVKWLASNDVDFSKYTLLSSPSESGTKAIVETYNEKAKTSYTTTSFDPTKENWYWIEVADSFGYSIIGTGKTNTIDNPPAKPVLNLINYDHVSSQLKFSWEKSNDNDFASYKIYESDSSSMYSPLEKFYSEDNTVTNFDLSFDKDLTKYYQLEAKDKWGLTNLSDIQVGDSHAWFAKTFGEDGYQYDGRDVQQTADGGYIILGRAPIFRPLLIKTNLVGVEEWRKEFGDSNDNWEGVFNIELTSDGGYIFISEKVENIAGVSDNVYYVVKTNSLGEKEWEKSFSRNKATGGKGKIKPTSDGGYIISGSKEFNNETSAKIWLMKINASGEEVWSKELVCDELDLSGDQHVADFKETTDGGYIILGISRASGTNWFAIKTDSNGNKELQRSYVGTGDRATTVLETSTHYLFTGEDSGNFTLNKIPKDMQGNLLTERHHWAFGGLSSAQGHSMELIDGGVIVTGWAWIQGSNVGLFIAKIIPDHSWIKFYNASKWDDKGYSVKQTLDGGYIITGVTHNENVDGWKIVLIKTDKDGNTKPGIFD
jgi:hypothetical protein